MDLTTKTFQTIHRDFKLISWQRMILTSYSIDMLIIPCMLSLRDKFFFRILHVVTDYCTLKKLDVITSQDLFWIPCNN